MFFKLLTILIIIEGMLAKDCKLTSSDMDRKWIFATKPTRMTWDVLHSDVVKEGKTIYLICDSLIRTREITCKKGKLVKKGRSKCVSRIRPEVVQVANENSCRRMGGNLYQVRYSLQTRSKILLYEVCYSKVNERVLYSRHKAYGFNLSASTYNRPIFSRGDEVSRECELSYETENVYDTFVKLLGSKQKYVADKKALILDRGHLANSQDFPSYDQMDATFKYINVMPQFSGINRGNWKRIENWIHRLPARYRYAEVVTGSFGVLSLPHSTKKNSMVPIYLMANDKNPVPMWTYKVVKYANKCYAFVTLNNAFNEDTNISTPYCKSIACPEGLVFNSDPKKGVSYCCKYYDFVRNIGRHAVLC